MLVTLTPHGERRQSEHTEPPFHQWTETSGAVRTTFHRCGDKYLIRFLRWADFEISSDGLRVDAWAAPGVPLSALSYIYINQIYPLALARQGKLVLHAGAIDFQGRALAFLGPSGAGKSTLAAGFATAGLPFLTDDALHLEHENGQWLALPSEPSVRLWKDSRLALGGEDAALTPALPYTRKRGLLASEAMVHCKLPRPLHRVYVLGPGTDVHAVKIERLKPIDSLHALAKSYFTLDLVDKHRLAQHFDRLTTLVNLPIHFSLDYPRSYESLPSVRDAVLAHALEPESEMT